MGYGLFRLVYMIIEMLPYKKWEYNIDCLHATGTLIYSGIEMVMYLE